MRVEPKAGHPAWEQSAAGLLAGAEPLSAARAALSPLATRLRNLLDRTIAASSTVSRAPVLDVRDFAWSAGLRADWQAIRDEASACAPPDSGRAIALWRACGPVAEATRLCPRTAAQLARIPGLVEAGYTTLAPGAHAAQRGPSSALIACHLGLAVPRQGDVRMRLGDRVLRWAEGETLIFDDSRPHEVWNDAAAPRTLLTLRFRRPLRAPGRWLGEWVITRSCRPRG